MTTELHPLMKRVLDGELKPEGLPPELRAEGEAFARLVASLDRDEAHLATDLDRRVMVEVRRHAARRGWSWWVAPREVRLVIRPWMAGAALAAAAGVVAMVARPRGEPSLRATPTITAQRPESTFVRFELYAPDARSVSLAGSFNRWNAGATPLVRVRSGLWTATVALPPGTSQYGFIVDGQRWIPDPAAPSVDDGFGRRNSVIAVPGETRTL
jgi:hypothetical protein